MKTTRTTSELGPIGTILIGVIGTVASVLVTMKLKKMLEERGLSERTEDFKEALHSAGARARDMKDSAAEWVASKADRAARKAESMATRAVDTVDDVATEVAAEVERSTRG